MQEWLAEVDMLVPRSRKLGTVLAILTRAGRYRVLVLDGSAKADQLAAVLMALRPRRPAVVMSASTWKQEAGPVTAAINKLGIRAMDGPRNAFCVHSSFEEQSFARTWGPLRATVRFTPWPYTLTKPQLSRRGQDNGHVFAGGNSLRDYDAVIEAARQLADTPVDIATSVLTEEQVRSLPDNVHARWLPQDEYDELMINASVVVVALEPREDRGSGQTTYVNAMARGKALVVTDTPGVRDYIDDGRTGLVVPPGDGAAIASAVRRLLDDPEERRAMGERARQHALGNLSLTHYALRLLDVARERSV